MKPYKYIFFALSILSTIKIQAQTILRVDQSATGTGDGLSWANAFPNLQVAIDAAELAAITSPAQVWVKAATYYPTSTTDRTISFVMKNDVEIYGGFAGNETTLNQRDWVTNSTILSGDIGVLNVNTDNSRVVIHNSNFPATPLLASAVLDGFTVEDGYLDLTTLSGGAGMRNNNSSPTIRNCTFRNNINSEITDGGTRGGAILNVSESSPIIQSCIFHDNSARSGAAIAYRSNVVYATESYIYNSLFYNNTSYYLGGAIYVENHGVTMINNTIVNNTNTGNQGFGWGGGVYYKSINGAASADFANNIFWDNTALVNNDIYLAGSQNFPVYTTNLVKSFSSPNPIFNDPVNNDYSLNYCASSPAINAGTNSFVPALLTLDLNQDSRINNTTVDIGVYESQFVKPFFSAIETTDISCFNAADGVVSMNAAGGSGTLTYSIDGVNFSSNPIISGVDIGSYTISVKDANDCITTSPITISQPTELILSTSVTNNSCNAANDGKIDISATGSSGTYEYQLNSGVFQSSSTFDNLSAGNYTVTVRDQGTITCFISTGSISITEPDVLSLPIINKIDVTCNGANDGIFSFARSGGVPPYEQSIDGINFQNNAFENLAPGAYTMTLRDSKGCILLENFTINEPPMLGLTLSKTDLICNGELMGQIEVTPSGGTAPYEYAIDGTTFQTSTNFSNLAAGNYTVTIKDDNACLTTELITIDQPDVLQLSLIVSDISCNGLLDGAISATGTGGSGGIEYSIDGTNFSSIANFQNLSKGNYSVTVRDINGCELVEGVSLVEPDVLIAQLSKTDVTCNGDNNGRIAFSASGGTGSVEASIDGINFQTGDFTDLAPGNYSVSVKDVNGCTYNEDITITEPAVLSVTLTKNDITCPGTATGQISVTASGGTVPYEYSLDGTNYQSSAVFSLSVGANYTVSVKDANGCIVTDNATVNEPDVLVVNETITNPPCNGESSGSISVVASGGTSPYEYSIDGITFETTGEFTSLTQGIYTIDITDSNGCSYSEQYTINEPDALSLSGNFDGEKVALSTIGGVSPYEYSVDGSTFQSGITFVLVNGQYIFTVRDANGCVATTTDALVITGVDKLEKNSAISIYPNPSSDEISIQGMNSVNNLQIVDQMGRTVFDYKGIKNHKKINIEYLEKGTYFLILEDVKGDISRLRVIKK